jgi:hypothetical protein
MKYKTAQEMAAGLRWLADFIETHGVEIPLEYGISDPKVNLNVYCQNKEDMASLAKALASQGMVSKDFSTDYAYVRKNFGPHVKVEGWSSRDRVCRAKVVGTKTQPIREFIDTGRTEEVNIIEWECDPILAD